MLLQRGWKHPLPLKKNTSLLLWNPLSFSNFPFSFFHVVTRSTEEMFLFIYNNHNISTDFRLSLLAKCISCVTYLASQEGLQESLPFMIRRDGAQDRDVVFGGNLSVLEHPSPEKYLSPCRCAVKLQRPSWSELSWLLWWEFLKLILLYNTSVWS